MAVGIGKKTEQAQQAIVRYIWDRKLLRGDRLPSCATIAAEIGLGDATVFRAIKNLQKDGILEARDKVGVFVADPRTPGLAGYQVGILTGCVNRGAMSNALTSYLQSHLEQSGCRSLVFHGAVGMDSAHEDALSHHLGVRQCIERGEIHALILLVALSEENWEFLRKNDIPACYVGGFSYLAAPWSVTLDLIQTVRSGAERLLQCGATRPGLLLPPLDTGADALGVWCSVCGREAFYMTYTNYRQAGKIAERLLAVEPEKRPDMLLLLDDYLAQALFAELVQCNGLAYLPHPVVLKPREIPIFLPIKSDFLEFSVETISRRSIDLLLLAIREENYPRMQMQELTILMPASDDAQDRKQ